MSDAAVSVDTSSAPSGGDAPAGAAGAPSTPAGGAGGAAPGPGAQGAPQAPPTQQGRVIKGGGENGADLVLTDAQLSDPGELNRIFHAANKRYQRAMAAEQRAAQSAQPQGPPQGYISQAELEKIAAEDPLALLDRLKIDPRALNRKLITAGSEETRIEKLERQLAEREERDAKAAQEREESERQRQEQAESLARHESQVNYLKSSGVDLVEEWAEAEPGFTVYNLKLAVGEVLRENGLKEEALEHLTPHQIEAVRLLTLKTLEKNLKRIDETRASRAARRTAERGGAAGAAGAATAPPGAPAASAGAAPASGSTGARPNPPRGQDVTQGMAGQTSGKKVTKMLTPRQLERLAIQQADELDRAESAAS
jgi:hypothetical protein